MEFLASILGPAEDNPSQSCRPLRLCRSWASSRVRIETEASLPTVEV